MEKNGKKYGKMNWRSLVEKDVDESTVKNKYGIVVERKQDTFIATCCQCRRKVGKGIARDSDKKEKAEENMAR